MIGRGGPERDGLAGWARGRWLRLPTDGRVVTAAVLAALAAAVGR